MWQLLPKATLIISKLTYIFYGVVFIWNIYIVWLKNGRADHCSLCLSKGQSYLMHRKINKYTKIQYSRAVNEGERHKFWNIPINMHMGIHRGTDQPVAIMDSWIQCMHTLRRTKGIFHLIASTAVCRRQENPQQIESRAER